MVGPALGNNFPGREQRRQRGVQSGGHLHHVHADDVEAVKKALQQVQELPGGEAAELGRAGTGGIGGVQAVNIQSDIDFGEPLHRMCQKEIVSYYEFIMLLILKSEAAIT